jgi:epidermal growth factor receptor substrate 15
MKSGLSPFVLSEIWQLADPKNQGFLDQQGFSVALRIIGHVQNGQTLAPNLGDRRKLDTHHSSEIRSN